MPECLLRRDTEAIVTPAMDMTIRGRRSGDRSFRTVGLLSWLAPRRPRSREIQPRAVLNVDSGQRRRAATDPQPLDVHAVPALRHRHRSTAPAGGIPARRVIPVSPYRQPVRKPPRLAMNGPALGWS